MKQYPLATLKHVTSFPLFPPNHFILPQEKHETWSPTKPVTLPARCRRESLHGLLSGLPTGGWSTFGKKCPGCMHTFCNVTLQRFPSRGGICLSTSLSLGFYQVACFHRWGIRKHDGSRDITSASALGLFSLAVPENPVI